MISIDMLVSKALKECEFAKTMKQANQFEQMKEHFAIALDCIQVIKKSLEKNLEKLSEWIQLELFIIKELKNYHLHPISDTEFYKCMNHSVFSISNGNVAGTCFLVFKKGNEYYFVTNKHVVSSNSNCFIQDTSQNININGKVICCDEINDLALVKVKYTNKDFPLVPVHFADLECLTEGMKINIIGNRSGLKLSFISGYVSSFLKNKILMSITTEHGTSGSAIFDQYGSVIGINCGDIAEVPFALNGVVIIKFLMDNGIRVILQKQVKY